MKNIFTDDEMWTLRDNLFAIGKDGDCVIDLISRATIRKIWCMAKRENEQSITIDFADELTIYINEPGA